MAYAADVIIMGRRQQYVKEILTLLVEQTNKYGLKENKKIYIIVSWKPYDENKYVKLSTCNFAVGKGYTYHGKIL